MKKPKTFRLSELSIARLEVLAGAAELTQTAYLEQLLKREAGDAGVEVAAPAEKPPGTKLVRLYGDNAGGLHLHQEGHDTVFLVDGALPGADFARDASSMAAGEGYANRTTERYPAAQMPDWDEVEGGLVAVYENGRVSVVGSPGTSAREYLGLGKATPGASFRVPHAHP